MEQSKPSQELISLGKKIISEFSREGSSNTSLQWMAHYLAELIQKVENATSDVEKQVAQKECYSLILDLWKQRAYFPERTAPVAKLSHTISVINALKDEDLTGFPFSSIMRQDEDSPISNYLYKMRKSFDKIFSICLAETVNKIDLNAETEWLEHLQFLKTEEKEIIKKVNAALTTDSSINNKKEKNNKKSAPPKVNNDFVDLIIEKLELQHSAQLEYLESLKKKLLLDKQKKNNNNNT